MDSGFKYIMFEKTPGEEGREGREGQEGREGRKTPLIFPRSLKHSDFAEMVSPSLGVPVSAGFLDRDLLCYGESLSLGLHSREEDTGIIRDKFKSHTTLLLEKRERELYGDPRDHGDPEDHEEEGDETND